MSTVKEINTLRLISLLNEHGREGLRNVFDAKHPPASLSRDLQTRTVKNVLQNLRRRHFLNLSQWNELYPTVGTVSSLNFDISLLCLLLRSICGLKPENDPVWKNLAAATDRSLEANITRIRLYRNEVIHSFSTGMIDTTFEDYWKDIGDALVDLGVDKAAIDSKKTCPLDEEWYQKLLKEWQAEDESTKEMFKALKKDMGEIMEKLTPLSTNVDKSFVLQKLTKMDFKGDVDQHAKRCHRGTREWLFNKVDAWFNDEESDSRVLIITGNAGMGKTVFCARACQLKMADGALAGAHFCRYNNAKRRSPKLMLQSLASSLCSILPEYKEALMDQLASGPELDLSALNLDELFTELFQDPLAHVQDPGKKLLFAIDALDECEYEGENELLSVISEHFPKLPPWLKVLITSRPEVETVAKLRDLKPLVLSAEDDDNLRDIEVYLKEELPPYVIQSDIEQIVAIVRDKSEGLMLYAYYFIDFISQLTERLGQTHAKQLFPKGIASVYEQQFQQLKDRLKVPDEKFRSFLSGLVAAKEPLPVSVAVELLGMKPNSSKAQKTIRQAVGLISKLLPMPDGRIHVFHKSITDWLSSKKLYGFHDFLVDSGTGHRSLAKICARVFDEVKSAHSLPSNFSDADKYFLQHGTYHLVKTCKSGKCTSDFYKYVFDLEIIHAKLLSHPRVIYSIIEELMHVLEYFEFDCDDDMKDVAALSRCLLRHTSSLNDNPNLLFQYILNEAESPLASLEVKGMIKKPKYQDIVIVEVQNNDVYHNPVLARFQCESKITCFDVIPVEKLVACGCQDGSLYLWSLVSGRQLWKKQTQYRCVSTCAISPTGAFVVFGNFASAYSRAGELKPLLCWGSNSSEPDFVHCAFSSDGSYMITSDSSPRVLVLDMRRCRPCGNLEHKESVTSCIYIQRTGCELIATITPKTLNIWKANTLELFLCIPSLCIDSNIKLQYVFSAKGEFLLCIKETFNAQGLMIDRIFQLDYTNSERKKALTKVFLSGTALGVFYLGAAWDSGRVYMAGIVDPLPDDAPFDVNFIKYQPPVNPDFLRVIGVDDSTVLIKDRDTLCLSSALSAEPPCGFNDESPSGLAFADKSSLISCHGQTLATHNTNTGKITDTKKHFIGALDFCVSPDVKSVLVNIDGKIELWTSDFSSCKRIFRFKWNVYCMCFVTSNCIVIGEYQCLRVINVNTEEVDSRGFWPEDKQQDFSSCAASSNGEYIASTGTEGGVMLWKPEADSTIVTDLPCKKYELTGHIRFSSNDDRVLVCIDGSVHILEIPTLQLTATLQGHQRPIVDSAFLSTSDAVVSISMDNTLRLWSDDYTEIGQIEFMNDWAMHLDVSAEERLIAVALESGKVLLIKLHLPGDKRR